MKKERKVDPVSACGKAETNDLLTPPPRVLNAVEILFTIQILLNWSILSFKFVLGVFVYL